MLIERIKIMKTKPYGITIIGIFLISSCALFKEDKKIDATKCLIAFQVDANSSAAIGSEEDTMNKWLLSESCGPKY